MDHEAIELVRSIRNRCDLLLSEAVRHELSHTIYTLCEDLLIDAQQLVDQVCVMREGQMVDTPWGPFKFENV
jgi:ABC-type microcin C transport system duplicated ATPase subunit YejF